jgi:hypothetical protein
LCRDHNAGAGAAAVEAQEILSSDRWERGDVVSLVAIINNKVLVSQLTDQSYWILMMLTEVLPPLHHAWDLLAQLGLSSLVGSMSFLGTQVQNIGTGHKIVTKCYGLTASLTTKPTLVGSRTTWLSRNQFFRLAGGVTSATPSVLHTLRLGKHSTNYMVLGLGTDKSQKSALNARHKVQMILLVTEELAKYQKIFTPLRGNPAMIYLCT